uniref:Reverse transcriptase domain-containing protein n=1 Tax=Trichuris muris TaxID=70415 RepID=A0A5S6R1I0_TRIMR
MERFYLEMHGALNILRSRGRFVELRSAYTLQSIVPKLTYRLQHQWAQRAFDVRPKQATIEDLDSWLEKIVLTNRMVESAELQESELSNMKRSLPQTALKNRRRHLNLAMVVDKEVQCVLCQDAHLLSMCPQFMSATPNRRAEILKENGRCFACLDGVHEARHCPRKLRSDKVLCEQYRDTMSKPVRSGIVCAITPMVENLQDGVRIVFDASVKFEGFSLNDWLSKEPDLLLTSDISSVFYQVGVPLEDRSVLRFLWNDAMDLPPKTYQFTRQVFGLISAPACCNYALLRCIFKFLPQNMALRFSQRFYVDSYLDQSIISIFDLIDDRLLSMNEGYDGGDDSAFTEGATNMLLTSLC